MCLNGDSIVGFIVTEFAELCLKSEITMTKEYLEQKILGRLSVRKPVTKTSRVRFFSEDDFSSGSSRT